MIYRDSGCRDCRAITSGDCGKHQSWTAVHVHPPICAQEIAHLEREREEDRAAIRALANEIIVMLNVDARGMAMPTEYARKALNEHAAAIARATGQEGAKT